MTYIIRSTSIEYNGNTVLRNDTVFNLYRAKFLPLTRVLSVFEGNNTFLLRNGEPIAGSNHIIKNVRFIHEIDEESLILKIGYRGIFILNLNTGELTPVKLGVDVWMSGFENRRLIGTNGERTIQFELTPDNREFRELFSLPRIVPDFIMFMGSYNRILSATPWAFLIHEIVDNDLRLVHTISWIVRPIISFAITLDGTRFAWVDGQLSVKCYSHDGVELLTDTIPGKPYLVNFHDNRLIYYVEEIETDDVLRVESSEDFTERTVTRFDKSEDVLAIINETGTVLM
jgi:hypothetical protein